LDRNSYYLFVPRRETHSNKGFHLKQETRYILNPLFSGIFYNTNKKQAKEVLKETKSTIPAIKGAKDFVRYPQQILLP